MADKVLALLGLAMRGRNLASGEFQTLEAIKNGSAYLTIVAGDASDNTKKRFADKCTYYRVPLRIYGDKESLARAIGRESRSSIGVLDKGLAKAITEKIDVGGNGKNGEDKNT